MPSCSGVVRVACKLALRHSLLDNLVNFLPGISFGADDIKDYEIRCKIYLMRMLRVVRVTFSPTFCLAVQATLPGNRLVFLVNFL